MHKERKGETIFGVCFEEESAASSVLSALWFTYLSEQRNVVLSVAPTSDIRLHINTVFPSN